MENDLRLSLICLMFYYINVSKTFMKFNNTMKSEDIKYVYVVYLLYSLNIYKLVCNKNSYLFSI